MKTRILFIIPPYFNIDDFLAPKNNHIIPSFTIPYGILSLEAYVKKNAHKEVEFDLLDLNIVAYKICSQIKNNEEFIRRLDEALGDKINNLYDIVAISALFNSSYYYLKEIINSVKKKSQNTLCVIGGGLASNLWKDILLEFKLLDGVCFGEGEIPLLDLINSDNYFFTLSNHKSWITKDSISNIPSATYISNLDDIPIFDYKILNLEDYNSRSLDKTHCNDIYKRELTIHTSRGCPFNCVFCANSSLHGKKVRYMTEKRVIMEVDSMIHNQGMNVLLIEDDHFMANKKRAINILTELQKKHIRIEFPNGIAVHAIDEKISQLLKMSGVTTVQLAVESCSEFVLKKIIDKPHNVSQIRKASRLLRSNGILVHAFIVLGLPGEMEGHRKESLEIIKEIGFDWVYFFIAAPIVGSRLYDLCIDNDYLIEKDFKNHIVSKGSIKAPGVDPDQIASIAYIMNLDVNFINNNNIVNGAELKALPYFKHIVRKYPEHAFANYMLHVTLKAIGKSDDSETYLNNYINIIHKNDEWNSYATMFCLPKNISSSQLL